MPGIPPATSYACLLEHCSCGVTVVASGFVPQCHTPAQGASPAVLHDHAYINTCLRLFVALSASGNVYGILPMSTAKQVSIYLMLVHQVSLTAQGPCRTPLEPTRLKYSDLAARGLTPCVCGVPFLCMCLPAGHRVLPVLCPAVLHGREAAGGAHQADAPAATCPPACV